MAVNGNSHRVILASLEQEPTTRRDSTIADDRMALLEPLRKASAGGEVDVLREGVRILAPGDHGCRGQRIDRGGPRGARPRSRLTHRNGYRERAWDTRGGTIELDIPRPRRLVLPAAARAPAAPSWRAWRSSQEAYVGGVSTRRVDDLVRALGIEGISKSQVSRMCAALAAEVEAFRCRPLTAEASIDLA